MKIVKTGEMNYDKGNIFFLDKVGVFELTITNKENLFITFIQRSNGKVFVRLENQLYDSDWAKYYKWEKK